MFYCFEVKLLAPVCIDSQKSLIEYCFPFISLPKFPGLKVLQWFTLSRNSKNIAKITDFLLNHLFHAQKIIMDMQVSSQMNSILQLKFLSWCPTIIKKHVQICCFVILTLKSFRKDYLRMLKAGIWKICSKTGWCKDAICKIKENLFITDLQLFKDCWCLW